MMRPVHVELRSQPILTIAGHHTDEYQPHRKWYSLGAATEFTLNTDLSRCRWRILPGPGKVIWQKDERSIEIDVRYTMKAKVTTLSSSESCYHLKLWRADQTEPEEWDLAGIQGTDNEKTAAP